MNMTKNSHDHTECRHMFARLSEYIDNELDDITCRDIERHLANCPPCQVCLATLKRTISLCKAMENRPMPKDVTKTLKRVIDNLT